MGPTRTKEADSRDALPRSTAAAGESLGVHSGGGVSVLGSLLIVLRTRAMKKIKLFLLLFLKKKKRFFFVLCHPEADVTPYRTRAPSRPHIARRSRRCRCLQVSPAIESAGRVGKVGSDADRVASGHSSVIIAESIHPASKSDRPPLLFLSFLLSTQNKINRQ